MDEPGRGDGRTHRGGKTSPTSAPRAEADLPAANGDRELRAAMALTEPGGGSDLQNMTTNAHADGDDLVISGAKTWITNARRCGLIALLCKTDPKATPRHAGISVLLVESPPRNPRAGLTISRDPPARLQGR